MELIKWEVLTAYGVPRHEFLKGDMSEVPSRVCGHLGVEVKKIFQAIVKSEDDLDRILEDAKKRNRF